MTTDDMELVRQYAAQQSESAFAALVSRHTSLVYSAALRRVRDPQLAGEVTQAVFILLARKAGSLGDRTILPGWLYRTACFVSGSALKQEHRRQQREQEAYMQSTLDAAGTDAVWQQMLPLLEEAMLQLGQADRDALVLRFFEGCSLNEVGAALGAGEDAAKKRVNRALEKLQKFFLKRGVSSTTATLAEAISANSVHSAPVELAKTVTAVALAKGATASVSTLTLVKVATLKSAVTFGAGSIGGLFATMGAAYVSLKAHADDSKSPRERQFMVRVFRKRAVAYLLWLAVYVAAMECDFFQAPIHFDFFLAAFIFYFFCVDLLILAREQGLRRRQMQIEDNTYVAAEWNLPRNVTDPTVNAVTVKNMLKAFRFQIFASILFFAILFWFNGHNLYQAWELRLKYPVVERAIIIAASIVTVSFVVGIYTGFLQWRKRPRFMPIRGDGPLPRGLIVFPILFPLAIGLLTLAIFDVHECLVNDGRHDSVMMTPGEILVFNFVVVLVYTAFTIRTFGILARRRENMAGTKTGDRSGSYCDWSNQPKNLVNKNYVGVGVALGMNFGVALGAVMHNLALGIGMGMTLGAAIGAVLTHIKSKD
ncbi:MAG TPA: sigma-70 family RNA polymerase sigma factor [Candidatus Sulfotelmatobacter sp.]|jgi:RNA polymerase sigma factor (sigma-70 family)|nr:sigma-70 family RNA polymerase sigma factor [Candidatus Sulfotelmatobacter sp.]